MRKPKYLSPTSISLFKQNKDEFYIKYLSDTRLPRSPQTKPMSIGSAFDAFVKAHLHERVFGKGHDPQFGLQALFEEQVEEHNRDWAFTHGLYAFNGYRDSGALADLVLELDQAVGEPKFETSLEGIVSDSMTSTEEDVVLLGKPDCFFYNKEGWPTILDWKVNGYFSQAPPKPGYIGLKDTEGKMGHHKNAVLQVYKGMRINVAANLETVDESWASQLSIYSWLCGAEIGEEFCACIDQLACRPFKVSEGEACGVEFPYIRYAQHRNRVSTEFQQKLWDDVKYVWSCVQSGHLYRDLDRAASDRKCKQLDAKVKVMHEMHHSDKPEDKTFMDLIS